MNAAQPVEELLTSQPDQNLSRLVSPRRLEPETSYLACVVPAFDAGRKAGLGEEVTAADEDKLAPAWDGTKPVVTLPVYYRWEFATGTGGDFETLARRLQAAAGRGERRPPAAARRDAAVRAARRRRARSSRARSSPRAVTAPGADEGVPHTSSQAREPRRRQARRGAAGLRPLAVGARGSAGRRQPARVAARAEPRPVRARGRRARRRRRAEEAGAARRGRVEPARRPERVARSSGGSRSRSPCSARSSAAGSSRWSRAASCSSSAPRRRACAPRRRRCTPPRAQGLPASFSAPAFRRAVKPVAPSKVGFPRAPLPFQAIATRLGHVAAGARRPPRGATGP